MAVRPFYISSSIDGRATLLEGGPAKRDGEMCTYHKQRSDGGIIDTFIVKCRTHYTTEGLKLTTTVIDAETNKVIAEKTTDY